MLRPGFRNFVLAAAIGLFHLAINRPVLGFDWVYFDDDINILLNPHLTGGSWETIKWAWTDLDYTRRYMPLGWMLFDVLFGFGGLNPTAFHTAAWALTAANGMLLFQIIRRYFHWRNRSDGWTDTCAAIAVLLLAAHPWRAELAGWNSGLLYVAGQFCASFAVLAALHGTPSFLRQLVAAGLYLMAQLIYPVFPSLPLIMLILAMGNEHGSLWSRGQAALRRFSAWLALAAGSGALNWFAAATSENGFPATASLNAYPVGDRLTHIVVLHCHYIGRLFWPGETAPFYGSPLELGRHVMPFFLTLTILAAGIVCLIRPSTRAGTWIMIGLFFASLLPFVGFIDQNQSASDRYAFLLLAVLAGASAHLLARAPQGAARHLIGLGAAVLAALLLPAYQRALAIWTDTDHLQARLDHVHEAHPYARLNYAKPAITDCLLGNHLRARKRVEAGLSRLGPHPEILVADKFILQTSEWIALREQPETKLVPYATLHLNLARTHRVQGHLRAAEAHELFAGRLSRRYAATANPP